MTRRKRTGIDPLASAMANDVEIGVAYERMKEASEFGLLLDDGAEVAKTTAL
ncbi:MAG TPA: hypothetical protein VLL82_05135 [Mycobacterium sp.]|jgi:hypothetical protein|nr:hypothetical protein [Mycobacterium sp.]